MVQEFSDLVQLAADYRKQGIAVGLVTGCFDVLHPGHVDLLRFAKAFCPILIVGLDNDANITLSKGVERPIHLFEERAMVLSELRSVNHIFKIENEFHFGSKEADTFYVDLWAKLNPSHVVTDPSKDEYWEIKQKRAIQLGIELILYQEGAKKSSSQIVELLRSQL